MLSLSSLLNTASSGPSEPPINDRGEHYSYSPTWKGGTSNKKKGAQSALSALTLLAFLFFLNMLQTCLRDQLQSNAPIVVMMTTTTTTTTTLEGNRQKREEDYQSNAKGETDAKPDSRNAQCKLNNCQKSVSMKSSTSKSPFLLEDP